MRYGKIPAVFLFIGIICGNILSEERKKSDLPDVAKFTQDYIYPGAILLFKKHDDADLFSKKHDKAEHVGVSFTFCAVYVSTDSFEDISKWYKEKCHHLPFNDLALGNFFAGFPIMLAVDDKDKEGNSVVDRPVSVLGIHEYDLEKQTAFLIIVSRGKDEKRTHILIASVYAPQNAR